MIDDWSIGLKCHSHEMVPFQSDTGTQWYLCSTNPLWHRSSGTWWPQEPGSRKTNSSQVSDPTLCWHKTPEYESFNTHHVHGGATQRGCHSVCLEVTCKPKVSWRVKDMKWAMESSVSVHLCPLVRAVMSLPILMLMELDLRPSGWQSKMFWGLRSLWRMSLLCRVFMAWAICCRNTRMVSSLNVPLAVGQRDEIHKDSQHGSI